MLTSPRTVTVLLSICPSASLLSFRVLMLPALHTYDPMNQKRSELSSEARVLRYGQSNLRML